MFDTGILIIPIDIKFNDISVILENTKNYVHHKLFIQFYSDYNLQKISNSLLPKLSQLIIKIYQESVKIFTDDIDLIIQVSNLRDNNKKHLKIDQDIEVILLGMAHPSQYLRDLYKENYKCSNMINVSEDVECEPNLNHLNGMGEELVPTVVLGGTFDRLHAGHKILLTEAMLRANKRVVVGVTDENMIRQGKVLSELILPVEPRINDVLKFLKLVDDTLEYDVVPISDPFGPTATDPDMDMIVVSTETFRGGQKVNELRIKNGLNELKIHTIELVDHTLDSVTDIDLNINEAKVSSSRNRFELLGKYLMKNIKRNFDNINEYLIGVLDLSKNDSFKNIIKSKGATLIEFSMSEAHMYDQFKEKINSIRKNTPSKVIFVIFDDQNILKETEIIKYFQEIWTCVNQEISLGADIFNITDIFFTTAVPLEPQILKAWQGLENRT